MGIDCECRQPFFLHGETYCAECHSHRAIAERIEFTTMALGCRDAFLERETSERARYGLNMWAKRRLTAGKQQETLRLRSA